MDLLNELINIINERPRNEVQALRFYRNIKSIVDKHQEMRWRVNDSGNVEKQEFVPDDWIRIEKKDGVTSVVIQSKLNSEK